MRRSEKATKRRKGKCDKANRDLGKSTPLKSCDEAFYLPSSSQRHCYEQPLDSGKNLWELIPRL